MDFVIREFQVATDAGKLKKLTVIVSKPFWNNDGVEAACEIRMEGAKALQTVIYGVDPWQALKLALDAVDIILTPLQERLYWPDGTKV